MNDLEQTFITKCVIKEKQERLLFELNGKKRHDGIGRFSHSTDELIKPNRILLKAPASQEEILSVIGKPVANCRIIAYNESLDKKECTFDEALDMVLGNGMPAIIIADSFAVIETEQCYGTPMRYIVEK